MKNKLINTGLYKIIKFPFKILYKSLEYCEKAIKSLDNFIRKKQLFKKNKVLINNKRFKDSGNLKRCFIIGNGPSANCFDFSKIKCDDIITVNQGSKNPKFNEIHPKYHFTIDNNFYNDTILNKNRSNFVSCYLKVGKQNKKVIYFFPTDSFNSNLLKSLKKYNVGFFVPSETINPLKFENSLSSFSILPNYRTVVLTAIHFAIYCGYKKIYLIGCEETNILTILNSKLNSLVHLDYCYKTNKKELERLKNYSKETSLIYKLNEFSIMFQQFEIIKRYCDKKGIKLSNFTKNSLIESIPYIDIKNI